MRRLGARAAEGASPPPRCCPLASNRPARQHPFRAQPAISLCQPSPSCRRPLPAPRCPALRVAYPPRWAPGQRPRRPSNTAMAPLPCNFKFAAKRKRVGSTGATMLAVWRRSLACHAGHPPSPQQLHLLSVSLLPYLSHGLAGADDLGRLGPGAGGGAPLPAPRRPLFSLPGADDGLAKRYRERKLLGYSPQQIFDVVAAVEHYREFVPWCQGSAVVARRGATALEAELEVGFQVFVERYVSHVTLDPPREVRSHVGETALFTHLDSAWRFAPGPSPASAWMTFEVDFEFKSPLYRKVAALFFEEVVVKMMAAFEGRCRRLYGAPSLGAGGAAAAARRRQAEAAERRRREEEARRSPELGGPAPVES